MSDLTKREQWWNGTLFGDASNDYVRITHYAGAFGEPNTQLELAINEEGANKGKRPTASVSLAPERAIEIGAELIRRAKKTRALRKRWDRQHVEMRVPLNEDILDNEDRDCLDERDESTPEV